MCVLLKTFLRRPEVKYAIVTGPIEAGATIVSDDGRFCAIANTKRRRRKSRRTRFPETTDITSASTVLSIVRNHARASLLTMIGSSPTIPGAVRAGFERESNRARLRFRPCCSFLTPALCCLLQTCLDQSAAYITHSSCANRK